MTTAGFVTGARDETAPTALSRAAALASVLHGLTLLALLPALAHTAFYIGVLAATAASVGLGAGCLLWWRATLVARTVAGLAAGATVTGELLQVFGAMPGARDLGRLTPGEALTAGVLATTVVVLLLADALRRRPGHAPDHPYAL